MSNEKKTVSNGRNRGCKRTDAFCAQCTLYRLRDEKISKIIALPFFLARTTDKLDDEDDEEREREKAKQTHTHTIQLSKKPTMVAIFESNYFFDFF